MGYWLKLFEAGGFAVVSLGFAGFAVFFQRKFALNVHFIASGYVVLGFAGFAF